MLSALKVLFKFTLSENDTYKLLELKTLFKANALYGVGYLWSTQTKLSQKKRICAVKR